jgi:hypothetical protein
MMEDGIMGLKSREIYEAPAAALSRPCAGQRRTFAGCHTNYLPNGRQSWLRQMAGMRQRIPRLLSVDSVAWTAWTLPLSLGHRWAEMEVISYVWQTLVERL